MAIDLYYIYKITNNVNGKPAWNKGKKLVIIDGKRTYQ